MLITISLILNLLFFIAAFYILFKKGGINVLKRKMGVAYVYKHSPYGPYYDQRKDLFDTLPRDTSDIIFLGHSIIDGCELAELFNNPTIKNRGISGETTEGLLNRLGNIVNIPPQKIFIMTGANDIGYGMPMKEMLGNCSKIIDVIKTKCPTTKGYLISVLPVGLDYDKNATKVIATFNEGLKNLAEKNEYIYIDLNTAFRNKDDVMDLSISNDGSHLMGKSYQIFKEKIEPYLY